MIAADAGDLTATIDPFWGIVVTVIAGVLTTWIVARKKTPHDNAPDDDGRATFITQLMTRITDLERRDEVRDREDEERDERERLRDNRMSELETLLARAQRRVMILTQWGTWAPGDPPRDPPPEAL